MRTATFFETQKSVSRPLLSWRSYLSPLMAMVRSSAPGVDCAHGELLPQITFAPATTLLPRITFVPQITFVPLTFDPQITLVAYGEPVPQITFVAPMEFNSNWTILPAALNDTAGDAADPVGAVESL